MVEVARPALVLVTGASGFVGSAVCEALAGAGIAVRRALRTAAGAAPGDAVVGDIHGDTDWRPALQGVDAVVHLAARTHVLDDRAADPLAEYRRINVDGTARLAAHAIASGVRRFVFMSSIKVNGERTGAAPFRESDVPHPEDAYGVTKLQAEEHLRASAETSGMALVVLRPPLVYGPGVKGNFLRLMQLVDRGIPLPVKSIRNSRALVYVGNLADAVVASVQRGPGGTYLVSDAEDVSTPTLVERIARALDRRPAMLPCPPQLLELAGRLAGRRGEVARLTGSLEIDSSRVRRELSWQPPYTMAQGLAASARWYHAHLGARSRID